jgi:hypothetical protein
MLPTQTSQVLLGAVGAFFYAGTVLGIGVLLLLLFLDSRTRATIWAHVGHYGFVWLGFVVGQGLLGVVWLVLALASALYAWLVWTVCTLGWLVGGALFLKHRRQAIGAVRQLWSNLRFSLHHPSWYRWVGIGVGMVVLLQGVSVLVPTSVDDALGYYLVLPNVMAATHTLTFPPFLPPFYGLLPKQVEMHWAALFTISNETAVAVWDYLCALSTLGGLGLIAWLLTSSRRVALLVVLMVLSTPAFYMMMGGSKVDNATTQYGLAALVWCILWPRVGWRAVVLAGLCVGWALASRYTNFIIPPGVTVFAVLVVWRTWPSHPSEQAVQTSKRSWLTGVLVGGIAAACAVIPMLIANWLLVGCPLAPQVGCQEMFWASRNPIGMARPRFSPTELLLWPFVWTFGHRANMLGHISPLFLGFLPFLVASWHSTLVRSTFTVSITGLVSLMTWMLIEPSVAFPRWLLVPFGLLAVPLSASIVAVEHDLRQVHTAHWCVRSAICLVILFLLFESRTVVYAVRYMAAVDSRATRYEAIPHIGYDVAMWLNTHIRPGQRVALDNWDGFRYFVLPEILVNSESANELQWLWKHRGHLSPADFWSFYAQRGFSYVVIQKNRLDDVKAVWPDDRGLQIPFVGRQGAVLRIEE